MASRPPPEPEVTLHHKYIEQSIAEARVQVATELNDQMNTIMNRVFGELATRLIAPPPPPPRVRHPLIYRKDIERWQAEKKKKQQLAEEQRQLAEQERQQLAAEQQIKQEPDDDLGLAAVVQASNNSQVDNTSGQRSTFQEPMLQMQNSTIQHPQNSASQQFLNCTTQQLQNSTNQQPQNSVIQNPLNSTIQMPQIFNSQQPHTANGQQHHHSTTTKHSHHHQQSTSTQQKKHHSAPQPQSSSSCGYSGSFNSPAPALIIEEEQLVEDMNLVDDKCNCSDCTMVMAERLNDLENGENGNNNDNNDDVNINNDVFNGNINNDDIIANINNDVFNGNINNDDINVNINNDVFNGNINNDDINVNINNDVFNGNINHDDINHDDHINDDDIANININDQLQQPDIEEVSMPSDDELLCREGEIVDLSSDPEEDTEDAEDVQQQQQVQAPAPAPAPAPVVVVAKAPKRKVSRKPRKSKPKPQPAIIDDAPIAIRRPKRPRISPLRYEDGANLAELSPKIEEEDAEQEEEEENQDNEDDDDFTVPEPAVSFIEGGGDADEDHQNGTRSSQKILVTLQMKCIVEGCSKMFEDKKSQQKHHREAHQILGNVCTIGTCTASFVKRPQLENHVSTAHRNIREFRCHHCLKTFKSYKFLHTHVLLFHHLGTFGCSYPGCTFDTKYRGQVYAHFKVHQCFRCTFCGKTFKEKANYKTHSRIHLRFKPYICTLQGCGYISEDRACILKHIRVKHFKLPGTVKEQERKNIVDDRDARVFIGVLNGGGDGTAKRGSIRGGCLRFEEEETVQEQEQEQQQQEDTSAAAGRSASTSSGGAAAGASSSGRGNAKKRKSRA